MKLFVVVLSVVAVATAAPSAVLYAAAPVAAGHYLLPAAEVSSQYHAQDELGQYSYGYNGGLSAKAESKSFDGVTRGSYSYLDAENKLQTVAYTADALNGFRVAASNLPVAPVETRTAPEPVQDTPEVAAAKLEHMSAIKEAKLRNAAAEKDDAEVIAAQAPAAVASIASAPATFAYSTQPIAYATYAAAPAAAIELKAPSSFSYSTYTHTAPQLAYTQYAAAAPLAYTASSYALPAAPIASLPIAQYSYAHAPATIALARSQPLEVVQDTPEVAQAKAEHFKAVAEAKARNLQ